MLHMKEIHLWLAKRKTKCKSVMQKKTGKTLFYTTTTRDVFENDANWATLQLPLPVHALNPIFFSRHGVWTLHVTFLKGGGLILRSVPRMNSIK